jgi:hypothetical protein
MTTTKEGNAMAKAKKRKTSKTKTPRSKRTGRFIKK